MTRQLKTSIDEHPGGGVIAKALRGVSDNLWVSSGGRESHPPALTEPDVKVSRHPARVAQPAGEAPKYQ